MSLKTVIRFATISLLLLLQACSTSTVHLYSKYLSKQEREDITQHLKNSGFKVIHNQLAFPSSITSNAIIYSALLQKPNELSKLVSTLKSRGIFVSDITPMSNGNHRYTKNSMALLLISEQSSNNKMVTKYDLAQKYLSSDCNQNLGLILREDGTFTFFGGTWSDKDDKYSQGIWKFRSFPYIELTSASNSDWTWYLLASKTVDSDIVSSINMINLKPSSEHPIIKECKLSFGIRS